MHTAAVRHPVRRWPSAVIAGALAATVALATTATAAPSAETVPPTDTTPAETLPSAESLPSTEAGNGGHEGVARIVGEVSYSNPFFASTTAQPLVILEDQTGFVNRDRSYVFPVESQVLGSITSDFLVSPFTYSISLPISPAIEFHDVDNDDVADEGVGIYAVAYWTNTWGDASLEERDQGGGGWSTAYASTVVSLDPDKYYEVVGGELVVFASDDDQEFPTGFGADGRLFTDDDPVGPLETGWTVVDLDQSPFGLDRSAEVTIDLLEPADSAFDDFSGLSYTDAFDAMIDMFRTDYAFTDYKDIDWDAKVAEFRPRVEAAEAAGDPEAFTLAIRDFTWSIPDGHVAASSPLLDSMFEADVAGGIGLSIGETDDGEIVVTFVTPGGPAEEAGIEVGAELTELGKQPAAEVVASTQPWSGPFSTPEFERLQQLRYATRFPLDTGTVDVTFVNPGGTPTPVTLPVVDEFDSFSATSFYAGASDTPLPVEFELLPSGLGVIRITDFFDNELLTVQLWERAIAFLNDYEIPGVVLDMRLNSGGSGWLADQMAAYFFDHRISTGHTEYYNEATGDFYRDPDGDAFMIPPDEHLQYDGAVVVLIGPGCISACEFFSYDLTLENRAVIVGQYSTAGAGGSITAFAMPEGLSMQFTTGRALDADGNIHLEGIGVVPDVDVPVTLDSLLATIDGDDVLLDAAEAELISMLGG